MSVLLSYGIAIHMNDRYDNTYLAGAVHNIPPGVTTNTFMFLYAAGLSHLEKWLRSISKVRTQAEMSCSDPQLNLINQRKCDPTGQMGMFWDYLKSHEKLREICDKDHKMREGTAILTLTDACRDFIRSRLVKTQKQNLFFLVPKLPLPKPMQSYLLFNETLEIPGRFNTLNIKTQ